MWKKLGLALLILWIVLGATVLWLSGTTSGLRVLVFASQNFLQERQITLKPSQVSGVLSEIKIEEVSWRFSGKKWHAKQVSIFWNPADLLRRKLDIRGINVEALSMGTNLLGQVSGKIRLVKEQLSFSADLLQLQQVDSSDVVVELLKSSPELGPVVQLVHPGETKSSEAPGFLKLSPPTLKKINIPEYAKRYVHLTGTVDLVQPFLLAVDVDANGEFLGVHARSVLHISGTRSDYQINGRLNASYLKQFRMALKVVGRGNADRFELISLTGEANDGDVSGKGWVSWKKDWTWSLDFKAQQLAIYPKPAELLWANFSLSSQQSAQNSQDFLKLDLGPHHFTVRAHGTKSDLSNWRHELDELTLDFNGMRWVLADKQAITRGDTRLEIPQICLSNHANKICLAYQVNSAGWSFSLKSAALNLSNFDWYWKRLGISGSARFALEVAHEAGKTPRLALSVLMDHLRLIPFEKRLTHQEFRVPLAFSKIEMDLALSDRTLKVKAQVLGATAKNQLSWESTLKNIKGFWPGDETLVSGNLGVHLEDLGTLDDVLPDFFHLHGQLMGGLSWAGTWAKPVWSGRVNLEHFESDEVSWGLHLVDGSALLEGTGSETLHLKAQVTSGNGQLKGSGTLHLLPLSMTLALEGSQVVLWHVPAVFLVAAPDVTVRFFENQWDIAGTVGIDQALVDADQWRSATSIDLSEVVFVNRHGQPLAAQTASTVANIRLKILSGKNARFTGLGLSTQVEGELELIEEPGRLLVAVGQLNFKDGIYRAYGKQFKLTEGALVFDHSPIGNPMLNVKAVDELVVNSLGAGADRLVVGVLITGSVTHPRVRLFSNPSMDQEDILSYLILGVPLTSTAGMDLVPLSNAALSLALNNGSPGIFDKIKRKLGISSISVGTLDQTSMPGVFSRAGGFVSNSEDDSAVFIEEQLSSKFSVNFGLGLFNSEHSIRSRYKLDQHWQVQTNTSSVGSGVDAVYVIEK